MNEKTRDRRRRERGRLFDQSQTRANVDYLKITRTLNCQERSLEHGPSHEPCTAATDETYGVGCLCPCHDWTSDK